MRRFSALAMLIGLAGTVASVKGAETPSRDARWHNSQVLYLLQLGPQDGWRSTPSGLRYRKVKGMKSTAVRPSPTDTVTIHYAGRFIDGSEFDSSTARGEPATFPLPRLIKGWQEGVPLMAVGDTYEFAIPQQLAYGPKGKGSIPGGATLLFTIELLGIGPAAGPGTSR